MSAFITKCPRDPAAQAMNDNAKARPGTNGVMPASNAPSRLPTAMPTHQLRQVKLWLMAGATGCRCNQRCTKCWVTMQL